MAAAAPLSMDRERPRGSSLKAAALIVCLAVATPAVAETFFRCPGNVYQRGYCEGGTRIVVQPDINLVTLPKQDATNSTPAAESSSPGAAVAIPLTPQMPYTAGGHESQQFYTPSMSVPYQTR